VARDWIQLLRNIEGRIPQAIGGADRDDTLRGMLVPWANYVIEEIDREQRWSLSWAEPYFTTTAGTENYAIPFPASGGTLGTTSQLAISRLYYTDQNGKVVPLERLPQKDAQRVFGEAINLPSGATAPVTGVPSKYAILPVTSTVGGIVFSNPQLGIYLYPAPDGNGPETGGNYKIRVSGYWKTPPIVECLANTVATSTTVTFSTAGTGTYLSAMGVPADGTVYNQFVSVRGAGAPTGVTALGNDDHTTGWSSLVPNTFALASAAIVTANSAQTFFNSSNWMIYHWPNLIIYGVMREISAYYVKPDLAQFFEGRYQYELQKLRDYEFDRVRGNEQFAAVQVGQSANVLKRQDQESYLDIRGSGQ
jgi:hypothetical protein